MIWSRSVASYVGGTGTVVSRTSPVVAGDTVYIGTQAGDRLLAIDTGNGDLRWNVATDPRPRAVLTGRAVYHDGVLYQGFDEWNFACLPGFPPNNCPIPGPADGPGARRYAGPMTIVDDIGRSRHVSLTTYRKDGTGVATPVWHVMDNGELFIVSEAGAWKVKRIRNNSRVVVTVCDVRGRIAPDAPSAEGTARLLDEAGTAAARKLLARKYVLSRVGNAFARLVRLRRPPMIGIAVTL